MKKIITVTLVSLIVLMNTSHASAMSKFERYTSFMESTESMETLYSVLMDELDYLRSVNGELDEAEGRLYFMYAKAYLLTHEIWTAQSAAMMYDEIPDWSEANVNANESFMDYVDVQCQSWLNGETTQAEASAKVRKIIDILKESSNTSTGN